MKLYSEKTKKYYDETEIDVLKSDEKAYDDKVAEQEAAKEHRAARAKEVEDAYRAVAEAQKKADDLLTDFCKDYGSFHTSIKNPISNAHSIFYKALFDPFLI